MKRWFNKLKRDLKINKEGIIGGMIVGFVVATYIKMTGTSLSLYESAQGFLFDRAFSMAPQTKEVIILYAVSIIICGSVGYILDKIVKPKI